MFLKKLRLHREQEEGEPNTIDQNYGRSLGGSDISIDTCGGAKILGNGSSQGTSPAKAHRQEGTLPAQNETL